jgi:hypothetical protein
MLSFDLSVIDIVLVIAVIILLILQITKRPAKTTTEEKPTTAIADLKTEEEEVQSPTPPQKNSDECPHQFGYLKKLGKNAAIPDECLSCSRMMKCLYSSESSLPASQK